MALLLGNPGSVKKQRSEPREKAFHLVASSSAVCITVPDAVLAFAGSLFTLALAVRLG